jgi:hypothetical protein
MHGQARTVERKIRLWVVQQERNRRKDDELARGDAAESARVRLTPARAAAERK